MKALIVQGVLFGDEGKGATVDYLCRQHPNTSLVVRYGGGAQCAHTVITPDNKVHTFSQFGSGTLAGVPTYLSKYVRFRPDLLLSEALELEALGVKDPLWMVNVSENCLITTIYHQLASERAATLHNRGTCGMGVGQTARYAEQYPQDALYVRDMGDEWIVRYKLTLMKIRLDLDAFAPKIEAVTNDLMLCFRRIQVCNAAWWQRKRYQGTVIFEGHQGALLDKDKGFKPYVTSSDCSYRQADKLLEMYTGERDYYAVMRTYATRHGVGDFPGETHELDHLIEPHNLTGQYQGEFRRGFLDLALIQRGLAILNREQHPAIKLVITHMDSLLHMHDFFDMQAFAKPLGLEVAILGYGARATEWKST